jgi:PqqD family protein of HPr-rel-A system
MQHLRQRYVQCSHCKLKQVGGETAVYDPQQRAIHVLNSSAFLVYEVLAESTSGNDLLQALAEETGKDLEELSPDLEEILDSLLTKGLIEAAP